MNQEPQEALLDSSATQPDNRTLFTGLRDIVARHLLHWPAKPAAKRHRDIAPPTMSAATRLLARLIPWGLGLTFLVSFFWDFDGLALDWTGLSLRLLQDDQAVLTWNLAWLPLPVRTAVLPLEGLLLVLSSSGLIGFFTNWLAIALLFRPRGPRPVFGQGVIPAQRESIIVRLATAIDAELIGPEVIKRGIRDSNLVPSFLVQAQVALRGLLDDDDFRTEIRRVIRDYVEETLSSDELRREIADFTLARLEQHFDRGVGAIAMKTLLQLTRSQLRAAVDRAIREMPQGLDIVLDKLDRMLDSLPNRLTEHTDAIEEWTTGAVQRFAGNLDIYGMLVKQMRDFDEQRLEDLIKNSSNDQLDYIKYLGGVLGTVGGLVIFNRWLALPALALLFLLLVGVDALLLRARKMRERSSNGGTT